MESNSIKYWFLIMHYFEDDKKDFYRFPVLGHSIYHVPRFIEYLRDYKLES